jgi:superfamily I DNA/RNA helicase
MTGYDNRSVKMDNFGYDGTYLVWGPPGTGKTTRLAATVRRIVEKNIDVGGFKKHEHPVLLSSLTRTAAAELAGRELPVHPQAVGTLHSHAFRSLELGKDKVAAGKIIKEFNDKHPDLAISADGGADTDEPDYERGTGKTPADEWNEIYHLNRTKQTPRGLWSTHVRRFAETWEAWKKDVGVIDFTDMIERALVEVDHAPGKPRVIIADEAQDMSALEYALLSKWGKAAGAMVVAGDPFQALYTWRGAHPELFSDPNVPDTHRDVLRQSYRIPKAVHGLAMRWVRQLSTYSDLDYRPTNEDGSVRTSGASYRNSIQLVNEAMRDVDAGKSVMILASCSYMLFQLVARLRDDGIPFANPWRTRRGDWNPLSARGKSAPYRLLKFLKMDMPSFYASNGEDAQSGYWTHQELFDWVEPLKADGLLEYGAKAEIEDACNDPNLKDAEVNIEQILRWFGDAGGDLILDVMRDKGSDRPVSEVLDWYKSRLLSSKAKSFEFPMRVVRERGPDKLVHRPRLYVGTIHSFKGAEADVVYLLPDLSQAGMDEWVRVGTPRDSIVRAFYVALTRAKESVVICNAAGPAVPIGGFANGRS